ncbi:MAG: hypothetical protein LBR33_11505 [Propionibacteriaceae bacterium]|jgi:hypothetical protein|nr:hypothetical protein [Propionibacteriaceae bacterium]
MAVLEARRERVDRALATLDRQLSALPDERLDDALQQLTAALAAVDSHDIGDAVGPVYTTAGLQAWLGVSRQTLSERAAARTLLRLRTADGKLVYPAFQFGPLRRPLPGLKKVLTALERGSSDPWAWAIWLNAVREDGVTFAQRLRAGEVGRVVAAAEADAAWWAA